MSHATHYKLSLFGALISSIAFTALSVFAIAPGATLDPVVDYPGICGGGPTDPACVINPYEGLGLGSILFLDTAGDLNTSPDLFWDNVNGRMGIGTITPEAQLDIATNSTTPARIVLSTAVGSYFINTFGGADNRFSIGRVGIADDLVLFDGKVGLGTSSPFANLQVNQRNLGPGIVSTPGNSTTLTGVGTRFRNTFKVGDTITVAGETSRTIATITSDTELETTVAFSGTPRVDVAYTLVGGNRFSVLGNGNVGIGTNIPQKILDVRGDIIAGNQLFSINNMDDVISLGIYDKKTEMTENTYSMRSGLFLEPGNDINVSKFAYGHYSAIQTSQDSNANFNSRLVGSQGQIIHEGLGSVSEARGIAGVVQNRSNMQNAYGGMFFIRNEGVSSSINSAYGVYVAPSSNQGTINNNYGIYVGNQFVGNESYSIYSDGGKSYFAGNVGIGTPTPTSLFTVGLGELFQVNNDGDIIKIKNIDYSWPDIQAQGADYVLANNGTGALSWADPALIASDENLKTNIKDIDESVLSQLNDVRTITYIAENDPGQRTQIGFLAQDLEQYFPELVGERNDGYKGVYYAQMTPILTKAIQELDLKINILEQQTISSGGFSLATLKSVIKDILSDVGNGIQNIFAKRVTTNELCVQDVCVNRDQFLRMVENSNQQFGNNNIVQETEEVAPEDDPVQDENIELENEENLEADDIEDVSEEETEETQEDEIGDSIQQESLDEEVDITVQE
jgi:hypothetical protein